MDASKTRIALLDKFLGILFNYLAFKCKFDAFYPTRFSGTILHNLFVYLTTEKFLTQVNKETKNYLLLKKKHLHDLLVLMGVLGDHALEERDRQVIQKYPSLFIVECLLGSEGDQILDYVFPKEEDSLNGILDIQERMNRIDAYLHNVMDSLQRAIRLGSYTSQIFGALLIRSLILQLLSDKNILHLDFRLVQFLQKRRLDYCVFAGSAIQVGKSSMDDKEYRLLDDHSTIFLTTSLMHRSAGFILLELLTSPDEKIEQLPGDYLDEIISVFEAI